MENRILRPLFRIIHTIIVLPVVPILIIFFILDVIIVIFLHILECLYYKIFGKEINLKEIVFEYDVYRQWELDPDYEYKDLIKDLNNGK